MIIQPKCYECERSFWPNNALPSWFFSGCFSWTPEFLSSFTQSSFNLYFRKREAALSAIHLPTHCFHCRGVSQRRGCMNSSGVPSHSRDAHRSPRGVRTRGNVRKKTVLLLSVKAQLDWSSTGLARKGIIGEEGFQNLAHHLSNRNVIGIWNASFPVQTYQKSLDCLLWLIPYFQWQTKCRL